MLQTCWAHHFGSLKIPSAMNMAVSWNQMSFKAPSNPNHSRILWFYDKTRQGKSKPSSLPWTAGWDREVQRAFAVSGSCSISLGCSYLVLKTPISRRDKHSATTNDTLCYTVTIRQNIKEQVKPHSCRFTKKLLSGTFLHLVPFAWAPWQ